MSVVVCVFQARDDRVGGPHQVGELFLGQASFGTEIVDFLRDRGVQARGLERSLPVRATSDVPSVEDLRRVTRTGSLLARHGPVSLCACPLASASPHCFRRRARPISLGGTAACCFAIPCARTTLCGPWKKYSTR